MSDKEASIIQFVIFKHNFGDFFIFMSQWVEEIEGHWKTRLDESFPGTLRKYQVL